jgi:hypothetical protein
MRTALIISLLAVAATAAVATAADKGPAHGGGGGGGGGKVLSGKRCYAGKGADTACTTCIKNKGKGANTCLACSSGPVPAELLDSGRCACPPGSALTGSRLTVKGAVIKKHGPATCSECAVDSFAPLARPVPASRCVKCPAGTSTAGSTGNSEPGDCATCLVKAVQGKPLGGQCKDVFGTPVYELTVESVTPNVAIRVTLLRGASPIR